MALADNFMWFPQSPEVQGETDDEWFYSKKAFEVLSFSFSLTQSDIILSSAKVAKAANKAQVAAQKRDLDRRSLDLEARIDRSSVSLEKDDPKSRLEYQKKSVDMQKRRLELASGDDEEDSVHTKFQAFTVNKFIDFASPQMYKACSKGIRFPSAMLAIRKAGGEPLLYIQFIFRDVSVNSITWNGGGGEKAPDETVTFEFQAMGFQYMKQASQGLADQTQEWRWSTAENQATLELPKLPPAPSYLPMRMPIPRSRR